ncbi:hypothetical protein SRHO_G00056170 [Serrasalmus rhombeus]
MLGGRSYTGGISFSPRYEGIIPNTKANRFSGPAATFSSDIGRWAMWASEGTFSWTGGGVPGTGGRSWSP